MWEIIKHSIPLCLQTPINCSHYSELQNLQDKNPQVSLAMTLLMTYKVPKNYKIITSVKHKLICFQADKFKQCSVTQRMFTVHTTCDSVHIKIKAFCLLYSGCLLCTPPVIQCTSKSRHSVCYTADVYCAHHL
jgi:hypothetical protein